MKAKTLPRTIYAKWHSDTGKDEDTYLRTAGEPQDFAEAGETIRVGVYTLQSIAEISAGVVVKPVAAKRSD